MEKKSFSLEKTEEKELVEFGTPSGWDWDTVIAHLIGRLSRRGIPEKRVRYQVEQDAAILELKPAWPEKAERDSAWRELIRAGRKAISEVLPVCVQCGACCRRGGPTLHLEDLELVQNDKLKPEALRTLRPGEPVHSPFDGRVYYLEEERIKVREQPGGSACIFFDPDSDDCRIWVDRPIQCRAQACWDSEPANQVARLPALTRRHILADLPPLLELLDEHASRCSHEHLRRVFDELKDSGGKTIDPVLEALAFEDHFRQFVAERFQLPADSLDFFFGRSFVSMLRLFGFRLDVSPDGTRTLLPDSDQAGP